MTDPEPTPTDQKGAPMSETPQQAYQRGRTETRLDHHESQIAANRVLIARTVEISASLSSTVQTLTEGRIADAASQRAAREAVKEARLAQESSQRAAWSPAAKLIAALGAVVGVAGLVWGLLSSLPTIGG